MYAKILAERRIAQRLKVGPDNRYKVSFSPLKKRLKGDMAYHDSMIHPSRPCHMEAKDAIPEAQRQNITIAGVQMPLGVTTGILANTAKSGRYKHG